MPLSLSLMVVLVLGSTSLLDATDLGAADAGSRHGTFLNAVRIPRQHHLALADADLTPAAIGPLCVPPVNLAEHADKQHHDHDKAGHRVGGPPCLGRRVCHCSQAVLAGIGCHVWREAGCHAWPERPT